LIRNCGRVSDWRIVAGCVRLSQRLVACPSGGSMDGEVPGMAPAYGAVRYLIRDGLAE